MCAHKNNSMANAVVLSVPLQELADTFWKTKDVDSKFTTLTKNTIKCKPTSTNFLGQWAKVPATVQNLIAEFLGGVSLCILQRTCETFRRRFIVVRFIQRKRNAYTLVIVRLPIVARLRLGGTSCLIRAKRKRFSFGKGDVLIGATITGCTSDARDTILRALLACHKDVKTLELPPRIENENHSPYFANVTDLRISVPLKPMTPGCWTNVRRLVLSMKRVFRFADVANLLALEELIVYRDSPAPEPDFAVLRKLPSLRRVRYFVDKEPEEKGDELFFAKIASLPALREFETNVEGDAAALASHSWDVLDLKRPRNPQVLRTMVVTSLTLFTRGENASLSDCVPRSARVVNIRAIRAGDFDNKFDAVEMPLLENLVVSNERRVSLKGTFTNLLRLSLNDVQMPSTLQNLQAPRLRELDLRCLEITTADDIAHLRELRVLSIEMCDWFTDASAAATLPRLDILKIAHCGRFRPTSVLFKIPYLLVDVPRNTMFEFC
jgi:hypothetical protein